MTGAVGSERTNFAIKAAERLPMNLVHVRAVQARVRIVSGGVDDIVSAISTSGGGKQGEDSCSKYRGANQNPRQFQGAQLPTNRMNLCSKTRMYREF
jgi:hypothetical protein